MSATRNAAFYCISKHLRAATSYGSALLLAAALPFGACGDDTPTVADTADSDALDVLAADTDDAVIDAVAPDIGPEKPGLGIDFTTTEPGETPLFNRSGTDWLAVGWPSDRWRSNNRVDFSNFPGASEPLLDSFIIYGSSAIDGFGLNSAIYLPMGGPIDPATLPSADASTDALAHLQLVNVTRSSPAWNTRVPLVARVQVHEDDPFLPLHTLALRPVFGFPLTEGDTWCAIVTRALRDSSGRYLQTAPAFAESLASDPWLAPLSAWLPDSPLRADDIAAATCFTTQKATDELVRVARWIDDAVPPEIEFVFEPFVFNEFQGTFNAPNFQEGDKPYASTGGGIVFNEAGDPVVQDEEAIRYLLLVPRDRSMPEAGWPTVIYSHGTGGDYESCRGTAGELLPRGFAVLCTDQPLHGSRGPGGAELGENDLILYSFNFLNPPAGRSSFRQAAADTLIQSRMISAGRFDIPATATRSGRAVALDPLNIMFFGHSHGGLSGTLALGVDANIKAGVISGMAGVLIETILRRVDPVDIAGLASALIGIKRERLDTFHPALTLIQTLVEATDPINYTRLWTAPPQGSLPRHMFITQGTLDDASPSVGTDAAAAAGLIPIVSPVSRESEGHRLRGLQPLVPPYAGNVTLTDGTRLTTAMRQWQGGSHFVATSSVARNIWGHFLQTAVGDAPPEVPAFGPLNFRTTPIDGADTCDSVPALVFDQGFPIEVRGNTSLATANFAVESCGTLRNAGTVGRDLVYSFTPTESGRYRFRLSVPPAIDNNTPRAAPNLVSVTTVCEEITTETCLGAAGRTNLDLTLEAGVTHFVHIDGTTAFDRGPFTFAVEQLCAQRSCENRQCGFDGCTDCGSCPDDAFCSADGRCEPRIVGDSCTTPFEVNTVPYFHAASTRLVRNDTSLRANQCPSFPYSIGGASSDLVYRFTAPETATYTVRADAEHDVVIHASETCENPGETCLAAARGLWDPSIFNVQVTAGESIFVHVDGISNTGQSAGDYTLSITACTPECGDFVCGDDGCGGSCGTCPDGGTCVVEEPFCHLPGGCDETRVCVDRVGDTCGNPIVVASVPFTENRNTTPFLNNYGYGEGWCPGSNKTTGFGARDVAYRFTAPEAGLYRFGLDTGAPPNVFDASIYLVGDCDDIEASCIAADDRTRNDFVWHTFESGESAFLIVDSWPNFSNVSGAYKLDINRCVPTALTGECGSDGCNRNFGDCPAFQVCSSNRCVPRAGLGCQSLRVIGALPWQETVSTAGFQPNRVDPCDDAPATSASPDITYRFQAPADGTFHIRATAAFPIRLWSETACGGACEEAASDLVITMVKDERIFFVVDGIDGPNGEARSGDVTVRVSEYCPPVCDDRQCGDDGCGGTCGTCLAPTDICNSDFQCIDPHSLDGNTCSSAFAITAFPFIGSGDTRNATNGYIHDENECSGWVAKGMGSNDQLWRLDATEAGFYRVEIIPDGWDAAIFAHASCTARASSCIAASDTTAIETLWLDLEAGETAWLTIDGSENILNDAGAYSLRAERLDAGP